MSIRPSKSDFIRGLYALILKKLKLYTKVYTVYSLFKNLFAAISVEPS